MRADEGGCYSMGSPPSTLIAHRNTHDGETVLATTSSLGLQIQEGLVAERTAFLPPLEAFGFG